MITRVRQMLSTVKNRVICNVQLVVYFKNDECSNFKPSINANFSLVENVHELDGLLESNRGNYVVDNNYVKFRYFLRKGCTLGVCDVDGYVVGISLFSALSKFRPYPYNKSKIFRDDSYYIFFSHTHKEYRKKGIYTFMLCEVYKAIQERQESVAYISTDVQNTASIRGIEKAGFKRLCLLRYTSIGPVTIRDECQVI